MLIMYESHRFRSAILVLRLNLSCLSTRGLEEASNWSVRGKARVNCSALIREWYKCGNGTCIHNIGTDGALLYAADQSFSESERQ